MSKLRRWLCENGIKHQWDYSVPQGPNCCFNGVDYPTWPDEGGEVIKHKCFVTDKRKCMYCGASEELTLDAMGHPTIDEYYWTGWSPAIPRARTLKE